MEKPAKLQLEFSALGIEELPEGGSSLNGRELRFVMGVLEHGQMARAAKEAGYSEDSAGAIAAETLRKPKVFAFYKRCVDKVASQAELVLRRCYERSVIFHAKTIEAAQALKDANEWLLSGWKDERGRNAKDVKEYELARERAQRDEKHYAALARAEDTLLLNALGRLKVAPGGEGAAVDVVSEVVREEMAKLALQGVDLGLPESLAVGGRN